MFNRSKMYAGVHIIDLGQFGILTDTGEDSKLVHRRIRPKVDTLFVLFFSDASERRV